MFYTPKPRQFTYRPRFYDPEKERWEALKQKYADERAAAEMAEAQDTGSDDGHDLAYFQRRVRELDREERTGRLTWRDAFRKRAMPQFRYQPRFGTDETQPAAEAVGGLKAQAGKKRIKRRFDVSDTDYMKPIPAGRIMLYALLVFALLYWILF